MRRLRAKFDPKCYALIAGDFILKFNVFGPVNLALFMILDKMSQNMIIFSCWSRFNTNLHVRQLKKFHRAHARFLPSLFWDYCEARAPK